MAILHTWCAALGLRVRVEGRDVASTGDGEATELLCCRILVSSFGPKSCLFLRTYA